MCLGRLGAFAIGSRRVGGERATSVSGASCVHSHVIRAPLDVVAVGIPILDDPITTAVTSSEGLAWELELVVLIQAIGGRELLERDLRGVGKSRKR